MTNNQLTDKRSLLHKTAQNYKIALAWYQSNIDSPTALQAWDAATAEFMAVIGHRETDIIADLLDEIDELQERRKASAPELNLANLANKFYERYPLATFKSDSERAEAFGYFMAGAELQCFGEFIKYEDLCRDE
ncbi:hypothetical protein [Klebsiella pneumoniae]|uniref:hypothetical protein n=1 Tax=Klebsiella pneumoniae TaxID=573 RepID=UPI0018A6EAB7|nr:hypothetical protein [Klebsiella pneumoniae]MBF8421004.1 hypothetical protein [Klebsiella pneumoniae]